MDEVYGVEDLSVIVDGPGVGSDDVNDWDVGKVGGWGRGWGRGGGD